MSFQGNLCSFAPVIEIFCSLVGGNLSGKSSAMIAEGKRTNFILNFCGFTTENLAHKTITCHQVKVLVFHNLFYYFRGANKVFPFLSDNVWRPIKYIHTLMGLVIYQNWKLHKKGTHERTLRIIFIYLFKHLFILIWCPYTYCVILIILSSMLILTIILA